MHYTAEHIYLCKQLIALRKLTNGFETPITVDYTKLDHGLIVNLNVLKQLLSELTEERVPVEGESTREKMVKSIEDLGNNKFKLIGCSTEKLNRFLKKISPSNAHDIVLSTINLPNAISWERLKMIINELNEVFVFYADEEGRTGNGIKIDFQDLGMKGRSSDKPGKLWWTFMQIAQMNGIYEYSLNDEVNSRKQKSEITKLLKVRFGLTDEPFTGLDLRKYKTKFEIRYEAEYPPSL